MNKIKLISFIAICTLLVVIGVYLMNRTSTRPSVIDSSYVIASDVDFTAELEILGNEKHLMCVMNNQSNYNISYGEEYYIEVKKEDSWYEVIDTSGKSTDKE